MNDKDKKKQTQIRASTDKNIYEFPRGEDMFINKDNLQIKLGEFKDKIRSSFSVFDLLAIISLWAPAVSADFKATLGLGADSIKFGYIIFSILITITIFYSRVRAKYFLMNKDVSDDPQKMVQKILEQCQKK